VAELVFGYASLAKTIKPKKIESVIVDDPDDDKVLACAKTAQASAIVSGDSHLLRLKKYQNIEIYSVHDILEKIKAS
jgi:predicted nucleic acid-binding protein